MKQSRWSSLNRYHCILGSVCFFCIVYTPLNMADELLFNHQFAFRLEKVIQQNVFYEVAYEATINQQANKENLIILRSVRGDLLVSEQDIARWKLPMPDTNKAVDYNGTRFYATADLPAATYTVDDNHLSIDVTLPVSSFEHTNVDRQSDQIAPNTPQPGGFFNYDFFALKTEQKFSLDGAFEAGLFNKYGVGIWNSLVRDIGRESKFTRLDTTWTVDQPNSMTSWRIGDAVNRGGSIGQTVRFGGLQYATNFATRPDLVTFPQLTVNGSAALPSTIDVYLNNIKTYSQNVPPGPFTLNNLPVFTGSGEARLVVKDLLGREQTITQPYYASTSLLTKDLHDYSYEAGFQRQDYGSASNRYNDFFASATHRYGFNNHFTAEAHAELQVDRQLLSLGSVYLLPKIGIIDATVAASQQAEQGSGQLISVGYEKQGTTLSFGARTQLASERFRQLGQIDKDRGVARLSSVFVGWQQAQFGSLSMNYINQLRRDAEKSELLSIGYNRNLFAGWFFNVTMLKDLQNSQSDSILMSITKALDPVTTANISNLHTDYNDSTMLQAQRNLPVGPGFGYRVLASVNDNKRVEVGVSAQSNVGNYSAEVATAGNQQAYRATVSGGMAYLPGHLMFARRLDNSFAVVDAGGYANVGVYVENQLIGKTNADGIRLIPNLRAYQRNNIAIEPQDVQLDAEIGDTKMVAVPYFRSADYLKFSVRKVHAATLRVVQKNGQAVPSGTIFTVKNSQSATYPLAQNGLLYISALDQQNHLKAQWTQHTANQELTQQCEFDLSFPDNAELVPDLGEFVCH